MPYYCIILTFLVKGLEVYFPKLYSHRLLLLFFGSKAAGLPFIWKKGGFSTVRTWGLSAVTTRSQTPVKTLLQLHNRKKGCEYCLCASSSIKVSCRQLLEILEPAYASVPLAVKSDGIYSDRKFFFLSFTRLQLENFFSELFSASMLILN